MRIVDAEKRYYGANATSNLRTVAAISTAKEIATEASITNKLARGTFPATFFLARIAALELDGVALDEI